MLCQKSMLKKRQSSSKVILTYKHNVWIIVDDIMEENERRVYNMYADENVIRIKHDVLYEVAKLAFEDELDSKKDAIAFELVPGPTSRFRCCVYKEREIIRQRVRLAEGKAPGPIDDGNIIQVISSACEDCPISSYTVTENCQNCVGKACINACNFGAIERGRHRSYIDPQKCKECGKCAQACPYNAIAHLKRPCKFSCPVDAITYDEHGISIIDESKCIRCGKCIHSCPFGAIGSKTFIVDVINAIKSSRKVYAMCAPATEGQFGPKITMNSWKKAMKAVGFDEFIEVGLGGELDATNIISPLVSVNTNIGLDHVDYLGDTYEKIAKTKAGIVKENIPYIVGEDKEECLEVFEEVCRNKNAVLLKVKEVKNIKEELKEIKVIKFDCQYNKHINNENVEIFKNTCINIGASDARLLLLCLRRREYRCDRWN